MKMLISNEELHLLKSRDPVALKCENCNSLFHKGKNTVLTSLKGHPDFALRFCSLKCHYTNQINCNWVAINCEECKTEILKQKSKIINNRYSFCSKSCSAKFQNKNKTLGKYKKSRSEICLVALIRNDFKDFLVEENVRNVLPSSLEIDIYIPHIKLAIEINGPLHFFPIFGDEKLKRIKNNDERKRLEAELQGFDFLVINISTIKYWKETKEFIEIEYLEKIKPLIKSKLKDSGRQGFEPR